jgi:hypothetical protein
MQEELRVSLTIEAMESVDVQVECRGITPAKNDELVYMQFNLFSKDQEEMTGTECQH